MAVAVVIKKLIVPQETVKILISPKVVCPPNYAGDMHTV